MKANLILALLGVIAANNKASSAALNVEEQMSVFAHEDNEDEVEEEAEQDEGLLQDEEDVHQEEQEIQDADDDDELEQEKDEARFVNDDSEEEEYEFMNQEENNLGQLMTQYKDFLDAAADADDEDFDNVIDEDQEMEK